MPEQHAAQPREPGDVRAANRLSAVMFTVVWLAATGFALSSVLDAALGLFELLAPPAPPHDHHIGGGVFGLLVSYWMLEFAWKWLRKQRTGS